MYIITHKISKIKAFLNKKTIFTLFRVPGCLYFTNIVRIFLFYFIAILYSNTLRAKKGQENQGFEALKVRKIYGKSDKNLPHE